MADQGVTTRLDRLERDVQELRRELDLMRGQAGTEPVAATIVTAARAPAPRASEPVAPVLDTPGSMLADAWRNLERGRADTALNTAFEALARVRPPGDKEVLDELAAFASAAVLATTGRTRSRAEQLRLRVEMAQRPAAAPTPPAAPPPETAPATVAEPAFPPPREPVDTGPGLTERVAVWVRKELTGARAFAIAGGVITLLGVIFFFVLAANRGWVGPAERVVLGGLASVATLIAGVALRHRYGRVHSALAAVGAGIAGSYATLAAATIIYGYLPAWGALLVAALIAGAGAAIAVAWSSQILAGIALIGAVVSPGLVALDDGISWPGSAFALVVLGATVAIASPRRWLALEASVVAVAGAQVVWLAFAAPTENTGAVVVACAAVLLLLATAIGWQAFADPGLDASAATFTFASGGLALLAPAALLPGDRELGVVLFGLALAFTVSALAVRRWRDLAWTIAAVALLLGGVATALLVSGRSLTVVWAIEAVVLAALGTKLATPRFQAASLAYLAAAVVQSLAIEVVPSWPADAFDVPSDAAVGLFVAAASALVTGLLQPTRRGDVRSLGIAAALDPLWDRLVRERVAIRALTTTAAAVLLGMGLAAVVSGRMLTIILAALATMLGVAAFLLGERRLQPFALGFLAYAIVHALSVEVPPELLGVEADVDPLVAVPSLVSLAAAASALSALARFEDRGITWLGSPTGVERRLDVLRRVGGQLQAVLALVAASAAVWAAGLVAVDATYEWGQVLATALWSLLGTTVVVLATRARMPLWQVVGFAYLAAAFGKAAGLDWDLLADGAASASFLAVATAVLVAGFLCRWLDPDEVAPVEAVALPTGIIASVLAVVALERLLGIDSRWFGVATLGVAVALGVAGTLPYLRWRAGQPAPWLRLLANGYWAIALVTLLYAESAILLRDGEATLAVWAATATVLALAWRPLREDRVWVAALALAAATAVGTLALVTVPDALLEASRHPAAGIWVLGVVIVSAWTLAATRPALVAEQAPWLLGVAAALTLYGFSLVVLEAMEWISGASVTTDFQRGHTVLSALWGIGALALYVVGLARDRRGIRVVGLALFGVALGKLFLYDLSSLSSITRAFSFLAVGAILLAAGFFAERLVRPGGGPPHPPLGTSSR